MPVLRVTTVGKAGVVGEAFHVRRFAVAGGARTAAAGIAGAWSAARLATEPSRVHYQAFATSNGAVHY